MKVLVLGCGGVGSSAAGQFALEQDVEEIICGDMRAETAKQLSDWVRELNGKVKTSAVQVDATRQEDIARAGRGVDLIYNATYPNCNVPILKACLDIGAAYIDLAAYPPAPGLPEGWTIEDLMKFDEAAKDAGITAISCMGIAPGYSNIAAHHMINQMDVATKVRLKWFDQIEATDLVASWWPGGIIGEWFGGPYPIVWEDGEYKEVDLIRASETYDFPEPLGKKTVYTATFHPELHMIPNYLPDGKGKSIRYVDLMGGVGIGDLPMKDVWIEAIRRQTIKPSVDKEIKSGEDMIELFATSFIPPADFKNACDRGIVKGGTTCQLIEVTGEKGGKEIRHTMYAITKLSEVQKCIPWSNEAGYFTALTGTMAGLMICRGEIKKKGVLVPDVLEEPKSFLEEMEKRGVALTEKIERGFL